MLVALRQRGYRCFVDDREMASGGHLDTEVATALRRSTALVVVATETALTSSYVEGEVSRFAQTGRPLVPVNIDEALSHNDTAVAKLLRERLWIADTLQALEAGPSDLVLDRLARTFIFVRRSRIRGAVATAVIIALLLLTTVALWQRDRARREATVSHLQLSAIAIHSILRSGRQAEALPASVADVLTAEQRLGHVPASNWNALRHSVEAAREIRRWAVGGQVMEVRLSMDESRLIGVTRDGAVRSWFVDGTADAAWRAADDQFEAWFTPNGSRIVRHAAKRAGRQNTMVYDAAGNRQWSGTAPRALVDVGQDGQVLAVSQDRREIVLWERRRRDGRLEHRASGIGRRSEIRVKRLLVASRGDRVAVVYEDGGGQLWHWRGRPRLVAEFPALDADLLGDETLDCVVSLGTTSVRVLRAPSYTPVTFEAPLISRETGQPRTIFGAAVSRSCARIALTYTHDAAIMVYDEQGKVRRGPLLGGDAPRVAIDREGSTLYAGDYLQSTVRVFDLREGTARVLVDTKGSEAISALVYCPREQRVVWAGASGGLGIFSLTDGAWSFTPGRHRDYVESLACLGRGTIVTGGRDGAVVVSPIDGSSATTRLSVPEGTPLALLSVEPTTLLGVYPSQLATWDLGAPTRAPTINDWGPLSGGRIGSVRAAAAIPGRRALAIAGDSASGASYAAVLAVDGLAITWLRLLPDMKVAWSVAIDPLGRRLAIGGVFDLIIGLDTSGNEVFRFSGVQRPGVSKLMFLDDDRLLAASLWGDVSLWNSAGERLDPGLEQEVSSPPPVLAIDRARERVYIGDGAGRVVEASLGLDELLMRACRRLRERGALADTRVSRAVAQRCSR